MSEPNLVDVPSIQSPDQPIEVKEQPIQSTPTDFKVYKPTDAASHLPGPLPDVYFEPTASDIQEAQATLSARTKALVDAPLQLRAARDAAEKLKRDRWPLTRIRVRFPDRTQLEKVFPSTDKIRSVYAFVRELLKDDVKPIKFILYQSPPKRDLKVSDPNVRGLSLADLQLAPSSVLLLRFENENLNHVHVAAPLLPDVLAQAVDLPIPRGAEGISQSSKAQPTLTNMAQSLFSGGDKKIPKWFKIGKK